jgi:hypothetical protein
MMVRLGLRQVFDLDNTNGVASVNNTEGCCRVHYRGSQ